MRSRPCSDALLRDIRELARTHQLTLSQIEGRRLGPTRVDQAVMLKLGTAVRQLTSRPDIVEASLVRLDALLRSSIGEAVLVAHLTNQAAAKPVADRINRLALEYLANPGILRPYERLESPSSTAPVDRKTVPVPEPVRRPCWGSRPSLPGPFWRATPLCPCAALAISVSLQPARMRPTRPTVCAGSIRSDGRNSWWRVGRR